MDTVTLMRLIGLGIVIVVFAVTIVLMPRIFGVNPPDEAAGTRDVAQPAPKPLGQPAEVTRASDEPVKG